MPFSEESGITPAVGSTHRWRALLVLLIAAAMDLLDGTVVNVAVPSIQQSVGASVAQLQWTIAGYMLAFGLGLITGGRLGDLFGRRRMFLTGVASFTIASLLAGLAPNPEILIAMRVLQGLSAAVMVPQILAIVHTIFPAEERPHASGVYGAVTGLAAVVGPILAGVLLRFDAFGLGWRAIFLINVPVGVIAFILAARSIGESRVEGAARLDIGGVALLTASLLGLLLPLIEGQELGWPSWMIALAVASVPLFVLFVRHERRRSGTNASPLVPLLLFRQRAFWAGLAACVVFFGTTGGFFVSLTVTLQLGLRISALSTGLALIPFSIAAAVGSGISIALAKRDGRRVLQAGATLFAVGLGLIVFVLNARAESVTIASLLLPLALSGFGMGLVIAPLVDVILAEVHERDAGAASGVLNATGQVGQAVGVALFCSVFFAGLGTPSVTSYIHALRTTLELQIVALVGCVGIMSLLPRRSSSAGAVAAHDAPPAALRDAA
jgi:EmrB/QacA subfamily drug resistance transporter